MNCPKCRSEVPDSAFRCPGCGLRKPKPRDLSKVDSKQGGPLGARNLGGRRRVRTEMTRAQRIALTVCAGAVMAALAGGGYWFVLPLFQSQGLEPETAQVVLEKLRQLPSNQTGLTVDESVTLELEKSRKVGNLVSYQGWSVRRVRGDKMKLLVVFSFDERGNTQRRAEWLADIVTSTYTPQTDLAAEVYNP